MNFESEESYQTWAKQQSDLPQGFSVGTTHFAFRPRERAQEAQMRLTLISLTKPTSSFAAMFTQNRFPGAPVLVGRKRLEEESLQAIVVNNKISNVGVASGVSDSEAVCSAVAEHLGCLPSQVLPSSTGIIGWQLPVSEIQENIHSLVKNLQSESVFPAAAGIMTTDLYPKVRSKAVRSGRIVGIAKGAGMIEPNLATMLVYLLTDIAIARQDLRRELALAVQESFNCISVDSDQSTSDTVAAISSNEISGIDIAAFRSGLTEVCRSLAQDVVRNGEGVHHVFEVRIQGAPDFEFGRQLGKTVLRSPLLKTALCGNDPNVGRILMALGNYRDSASREIDFSKVVIRLGGTVIFEKGSFSLSADKEKLLSTYLKEAELYASFPPKEPGSVFHPPGRFPAHQRNVVLEVALSLGSEDVSVWGGDLTHEYISENADYRS